MKPTVKSVLKGFLIVSLLFISVACTEIDFHLIGKTEITLEVNSNYQELGAFTSGHAPVTIVSNLDLNEVGDYTITYTTTFNSKEKSLSRIIHVVDTTAPVITLNGAQNKLLCPNQTYEEEGFTAIDNVDGDLSALVEITQISNGLRYSVRDRFANLGEITRSITKEDKQKPNLTLTGSNHVLLHKNSTYFELGATAFDNCDDVSKDIVVSNNINPAILGTYLVTYTVRDHSGNTSVITRDVEVTDQSQIIVYLTFDDGPSARTLEVLDLLKEYQVKATFFVGKKSADYEPIMLKAFQEGHTVALHAYSHNANTIYASTEAFFSNLTLIQDWVEKVTGVKSYLYRFPGGSSNLSSSFNPGIMTSLTQMVEDQGFHYFDWNVSSGDGSATTTSEQMITNVIKNCKAGRNNVVLMHDSNGHNETVAALRPILNYLKSIDAQILPITMDTPEVHHHIAN